MVPPEIRAARERILGLHLDAESDKDTEAVLGTLSEYVYDLVTPAKTIRGRADVARFLQLMFDALGPYRHHARAFHHDERTTVVEVETVFPDGIDGKSPGEPLRVWTVGIFPFERDRLLGERVYGDLSALAPYLGWADERVPLGW